MATFEQKSLMTRNTRVLQRWAEAAGHLGSRRSTCEASVGGSLGGGSRAEQEGEQGPKLRGLRLSLRSLDIPRRASSLGITESGLHFKDHFSVMWKTDCVGGRSEGDGGGQGG